MLTASYTLILLKFNNHLLNQQTLVLNIAISFLLLLIFYIKRKSLVFSQRNSFHFFSLNFINCCNYSLKFWRDILDFNQLYRCCRSLLRAFSLCPVIFHSGVSTMISGYCSSNILIYA